MKKVILRNGQKKIMMNFYIVESRPEKNRGDSFFMKM